MNQSSPTIRTFRAPDARSALSAVKAVFGSDAVILATKQLGGGLFGRPQVEVTAAAGAEPPRVDRAVETDIAALRRVMDEVRRSLRRPNSSGPQGGVGAGAEAELGADSRRVLRHLLDRGIDPTFARSLLDDALAAGAERPSELFADIGARVRKLLPTAPAPWTSEARRTIALVGPTGVGKTTAIAKIAARALIETGFKVGLITVDTYRVGASDQLARYGKIMGLQTHVARDREALSAAVERTRDADLVLIDTAGRSDAASLAAQIDMVKSVPQVQLHLAMSAATGARELAAVAGRYRSFGAERLIFTKLDEAEGPGAALAATAIIERPISCVCDGQRVPEDIHAVTTDDLLERLVGIKTPSPATPYTKEQLRGSSR